MRAAKRGYAQKVPGNLKLTVSQIASRLSQATLQATSKPSETRRGCSPRSSRSSACSITPPDSRPGQLRHQEESCADRQSRGDCTAQGARQGFRVGAQDGRAVASGGRPSVRGGKG